MPETVYDYDDVPTLRNFSRSNAFMRGVLGPYGSGKSSACVMEIIRRSMAQEPFEGMKKTRWAVIRNTYGQLEDTTVKTFHHWFPPDRFGGWAQTAHDYKITSIPGCEIVVMFRALDRPDHIKKLLSMELTGAWVNEAKEIPWTIIQALQGRVGRYPPQSQNGPTWHGIFMDTNPPDTDSWWYRKFEEEKPEGWELFKQPSGLSEKAENKTNLPPNYYENLAKGMDEEARKVYIMGEYGFVIEGKPVFPEYNDSIHCLESIAPMKGQQIYRGYDFGLTPACSFSQLLPSGQWIIFDEITTDSMGAERLADIVNDHSKRNYNGFTFKDYGDPAGAARSQTDEKTCFQILQGKGIPIEPGEQTTTLRIESVKKPLNTMINGKPGLQVSAHCKMIRKGFQGGYHYRRLQTAKEKYVNVPEKNEYSHVHDSIQYVATRIFGTKLTHANKTWTDKLKYDNRWIT